MILAEALNKMGILTENQEAVKATPQPQTKDNLTLLFEALRSDPKRFSPEDAENIVRMYSQRQAQEHIPGKVIGTATDDPLYGSYEVDREITTEEALSGRAEAIQRGPGDIIMKPIAKLFSKLVGTEEVFNNLMKAETKRREDLHESFEEFPWYAEVPADIVADIPAMFASGAAAQAATKKITNSLLRRGARGSAFSFIYDIMHGRKLSPEDAVLFAGLDVASGGLVSTLQKLKAAGAPKTSAELFGAAMARPEGKVAQILKEVDILAQTVKKPGKGKQINRLVEESRQLGRMTTEPGVQRLADIEKAIKADVATAEKFSKLAEKAEIPRSRFARKLTATWRYLEALKVTDWTEMGMKARVKMTNIARQQRNYIDLQMREVYKLEGVKLKTRGKFKKSVDDKWFTYLDKFKTAGQAGLTGKKAEIFKELRKYTDDMLERVNAVRKEVGLEPIKGIKAYMHHMFDVQTMLKIKQKYPYKADIFERLPKHIFNPTEFERVGGIEGLIRDPWTALKRMTHIDLKQIYLERPNILFREQMDKFGKALPEGTRKYLEQFWTEVILGHPTEMDKMTSAAWNKLGAKKAFEKLMVFFGEENVGRAWSRHLRRFLHLGTMWGRPKLGVRNHTQKMLHLGLYGSKAFSKATFKADKGLKEMIKANEFWKISRSEFMELLPTGVFNKLEKAGFIPYGHAHISNVTHAMKTAYYAGKELVYNPKYKKYGWTMEDVMKEMEYGAKTTQYWYNSMGMPEIFRTDIGKSAFALQSWWMNYTFSYWREILYRMFKGTTGWGKPIPPKWRVAAGRHIVTSAAFIEGMRRAFGLDYRRIALLGVLPSAVSPIGQFTIGLLSYLNAAGTGNEWQRKAGLRQMSQSWSAFIPGSGAWKDFSKVWRGEGTLKDVFFHTEKKEEF